MEWFRRKLSGKEEPSVDDLIARQRAEYAAKEAHDAALNAEFAEYVSNLHIEGIDSISGTASGENVMYTHVQCTVGDLGNMQFSSQGRGDYSYNAPDQKSLFGKKQELMVKPYFEELKNSIKQFMTGKGLLFTDEPKIELKCDVPSNEPHPDLPTQHERKILGFEIQIEGRKNQRL